METATDDEGDTAASFFYSRLFLFSAILLSACNKPQKNISELKLVGDSLDRQYAKINSPAPAVAKKKKKIYLTFDDGPNKGTQNVLTIAKDENIPVTFFIVGEHVFASEAQARTWDSLQQASNIELCNHSYTHALHNKFEKFYNEKDTVVKDIAKAKDALQLNNNIVRAPGRNSWRIDSITYTDIKKSKAAIDSLQKAGFIVMGWDLEWHYDPKTLMVKNTATELVAQIDSVFNHQKTKLPDNLVLLAHDQVYASSADSLQLRELLQQLKKKNEYDFELVGNYPAIKKQTADSLLAKQFIPR